MKSKDGGSALYDKHSKWYDLLTDMVGHKSRATKMLQSTNMNITQDSNILDLGCGSGMVTKGLSKKYGELTITGLDYSKEMLRVHQKKFPRTTLIHGDFNDEETFQNFKDGRKAALQPESFDLVISTGAVSEYADPKKIIKFVYKVLKKDGFFIMVGVKDKGISSRIISKFWKFTPKGQETWINSYKKSKFTTIKTKKISKKYFPANLLYYMVAVQK